MEPDVAESRIFKSGFTWRTILGLIISIGIFVPVNIYSFFLTGVISGSVAVFFITILFVEIAKLLNIRFTKQEVMTLYYATGWSGASLPIFYYIVYTSYYVNSPFVKAYKIAGNPISNYIPPWLVPAFGSDAYVTRTLMQFEYVTPVLVFTTWIILFFIVELSLGTITSTLYVERLQFPFPFATIVTSTSTFIAERPRQYAKILFSGFLFGVIWGVIAYLPNVFGLGIIPLPFYDLVWLTQEVIPGAAIGIATTMPTYVTGLIVPIDAAVYMFVTSVVIWIFLNSVFITTWPNIFPEWAREYVKGMGLIAVTNRAQVRVWFAPQIGFAFAITAYLVFKVRRTIISTVKEIFKPVKSALGLPSMRTAFLAFIAAAGASAMLFHSLVPEIPIWLPIFHTFGLSFFISIILTTMIGEVGFTPPAQAVPGWTWQALVYLTPYQGYAGFTFEPLPYLRQGPMAPGFAQQVKAAVDTQTKPVDLLKVWAIGFFLTQFMGLVSLDLFWRIAPIPSLAYPTTIYTFLNNAFLESMVVSRQINVTTERILVPMMILLAILAVGDNLSSRFGLFFSILGISAGLYVTPLVSAALLSGSLVGRYLMPRLFKKPEWLGVRGYLVSGEFMGEGLILMTGVAISLLSKSSWLWPY